MGNRLMEGYAERLREHGFTATILGIPACFEAVFAPGPITDYRGRRAATRASGGA